MKKQSQPKSSSQSQQGARAGVKQQPAQLKSKIRQEWSQLSEADVDLYVNGKEEQFFNTLQEKCNVPKEEAKKKIKQFESAGSSSTARKTA